VKRYLPARPPRPGRQIGFVCPGAPATAARILRPAPFKLALFGALAGCCLPPPVPSPSLRLALFDAHDKSRRVGIRPAFPGQYRGSVRSIPTSVGRVLFRMVGSPWNRTARNAHLYPNRPPFPGLALFRIAGHPPLCTVDRPLRPPGRANWLCFAQRPAMSFPRKRESRGPSFVQVAQGLSWARANWLCFAQVPSPSLIRIPQSAIRNPPIGFVSQNSLPPRRHGGHGECSRQQVCHLTISSHLYGLGVSVVDSSGGHERTLRTRVYRSLFSCMVIIQSHVFPVKRNPPERRNSSARINPCAEYTYSHRGHTEVTGLMNPQMNPGCPLATAKVNSREWLGSIYRTPG
jgi:hypothetical protein